MKAGNSYLNTHGTTSIGFCSSSGRKSRKCSSRVRKHARTSAIGYSPSLRRVYAYNLLFTGCTYAFYAKELDGQLSIDAENVTADQVGTFNQSANYCTATNCIFTGTGSADGVTGFASCSRNATNTGVYTNVGAGSYYLASGSTNRGVGTTNINSALLADLQTLTTYPPVTNIYGLITNDYTLSPQVERNTGTPDRGYHYSPIDYAVNIELADATITVLPGTVLAGYGPYGVYFGTNGSMDCEGTATSPNYLVQYNTVQEQSNTNWETSSWNALLLTPGQTDSSWANFAFTLWSVFGTNGQINAYSAPISCPVALQDCQFYGGTIGLIQGPVLTTTNCLFHRVNLTVKDGAIGNVSPTFCNDLFFGGELTLKHLESGQFTFRDNLFDQTVVSFQSGSSNINVCSNNAYVTTTNGFLLPTNGDTFLTTSPTFQTGALGNYYYPTNLTNLIYTGSQLATAAGLFFYTVTTNNVIDGTNMVSIGFHYVAVDSNNVPLGGESGGVSDYLEDWSGNGVLNPFLIYNQWDNPNEPQVRLGYWKFNTSALTNENGVPPTTTNYLNLVPDWSGNAVSLTNSTGKLVYPVTINGQNLFDPANGTIRFWYQPNWSSIGTSAPGEYVIFLDTQDSSGNYFQLAV
jgi:hypothetical protein